MQGIGDPIDGHDVVADRQNKFLDDVDVSGVRGVGGQILLGRVAAVKKVSEVEGRGAVAENWTGGEREDVVEGDEAIESGEHIVNLAGINAVFNLEEDDVFDWLRGHVDGERSPERGTARVQGAEAEMFGRKRRDIPESSGEHF